MSQRVTVMTAPVTGQIRKARPDHATSSAMTDGDAPSAVVQQHVQSSPSIHGCCRCHDAIEGGRRQRASQTRLAPVKPET
jgi:hypothetical protein